MWAWLLANLLLPALSYFAPIVENDIVNWVKGLWAAYNQKQIDAKNVQALKDAAAKGDQSALSNAEAGILNGNDSTK